MARDLSVESAARWLHLQPSAASGGESTMMNFQLQQVNVDLLGSRCTLLFTDPSTSSSVQVAMLVERPVNQAENRLKELVKERAKEALEGALRCI